MRRLCSLAAHTLSAAAHAASARAMPASMMPGPRLPQAHVALRGWQSGGHAAAAMESSCRLCHQPDVRRWLARNSRQQRSSHPAGSSERRQQCVTQAARDQRQQQHAQLRPTCQALRPSRSGQPAPWHMLAHQGGPWQRSCSGRSAAAADGIPAEASDAPGQQEVQQQKPRLSPAEDAALAGTLTLDSSIDESIDAAASQATDGSLAAGSGNQSSSHIEADPSLGLARRRDSLRRSLRYSRSTRTTLAHSHVTQSMLLGWSVKVRLQTAYASVTTQSLASPRVCCSGDLERCRHAQPLLAQLAGALLLPHGKCAVTSVRTAVQRTAQPAAELEQGGRLIQLWWPHQPGGYKIGHFCISCKKICFSLCGAWLQFLEVSERVLLGCRHSGAPSRRTTPCSSTTRELAPPSDTFLHACPLCCGARGVSTFAGLHWGQVSRAEDPQLATSLLQGGPPAEDCRRGHLRNMGGSSAGDCICTDLG